MSEVILEGLSVLLNLHNLSEIEGVFELSVCRIVESTLCYTASPCPSVDLVLHSLKMTLQLSTILHLQQGDDRTVEPRQS